MISAPTSTAMAASRASQTAEIDSPRVTSTRMPATVRPDAQRHPQPAVAAPVAGAEPPRALGVVEVGPGDDGADRDGEQRHEDRADAPSPRAPG